MDIKAGRLEGTSARIPQEGTEDAYHGHLDDGSTRVVISSLMLLIFFGFHGCGIFHGMINDHIEHRA